MKTIQLYGDMGQQFGREFSLEVSTPAEALRALVAMLPDFRGYLQARLDAPFQVIVGETPQDENGLSVPCGSSEVIKFVPVVAGAKNAFEGILLGAALIAVTYFTGGTGTSFLAASAGNWLGQAAIGVGMSMVLGGVAQLLASTPASSGANNSNNPMDSWSFGSPTLTVGQGGCVPLGYGTQRIGGQLISAGIDTQTWQDKGFGSLAPDNAGTVGGDGNTSPWVWAIAE